MSRDRHPYPPTGRSGRDAGQAVIEIRRLSDGSTRWVDDGSWRRVAYAVYRMGGPTAMLDAVFDDASSEWAPSTIFESPRGEDWPPYRDFLP